MKIGIAVLIVWLALLNPGPSLASDSSPLSEEKKTTIETAPECGLCARRHQAYARSKKLRVKNRLTPKLKTNQQELKLQTK